jgi:positive regulator of sigma E activity
MQLVKAFAIKIKLNAKDAKYAVKRNRSVSCVSCASCASCASCVINNIDNNPLNNMDYMQKFCAQNLLSENLFLVTAKK